MSEAGSEKQKRAPIDWESIELYYRAGIRSLMDIAKEFGVSDAGILKRAKAQGWTRDLAAKIKAKADAKVSAAAVSAELVKAGEKDIVDGNAELQYRIRMEHRAGLGRLVLIKEKLLTHLEGVAAALPDLSDVVEALRNPDDKGQDKLNDRMRKAMDRSTVVVDLKTLVEVDEKLRKGQREAFGIDSAEHTESSVDAALKRVLNAQ